MKHQDSPYQIDIENMSCMRCVASVEKTILAVDGVTEAAINLVELPIRDMVRV